MSSKKEQVNYNFDKDLAGFHDRQMLAIKHLDGGKKKFVLYGGAMGGGKSRFLRWFPPRFLIDLYHRKGMENVMLMLACEDYPSLKDRHLSKLGMEYPDWLGTSIADHKDYGRCFILNKKLGSGVICFRNLDDPSKYQSAEFAAILVDELTKNDYETFNFLRTRLRWPGLKDIECPFIGATNPGGKGHGWVKQFWMDRVFPPEFIDPIDYRSQFAYVPAKASDNPHLDPSYWSMLNTLPEHLRKAFRDGDWNIFVGQAFQEWRSIDHVIDPIPVPAWAKLFMTFDWGFGKPFSIGWWWEDPDSGRLYRFDEWYGWTGTPDTGLRLTDSAIAEGIKEREKGMGIEEGRQIIRLAGPDCFSKKPDYRGGGQGDSTAVVFQAHGISIRPGDPSRVLKKRQFHERLRVRGRDEPPMVRIYSNCTQFIRTIPDLVVSKTNPEDIDTDTEDHIYDEAAHVFMFNPLTAVEQMMMDVDALAV
jgi:hypothetical protein